MREKFFALLYGPAIIYSLLGEQQEDVPYVDLLGPLVILLCLQTKKRKGTQHDKDKSSHKIDVLKLYFWELLNGAPFILRKRIDQSFIDLDLYHL